MATSGTLRIPPPPNFAKTDPAFNRWLLEVTRILAAAGGIDPTQIAGWNELVAQVAENTSDIASFSASVASLQSQINAQGVLITALQGRNQVYNGTGGPPAGALGIDNDWYYNRGGAVGARLYIKVLGSWLAQAI